MSACGFSALHRGQRLRRIPASAACLLALCLVIAGCAALNAQIAASGALQNAGYQNVNMNVATGSGEPAGGLVSVSYTSGPSGDDQRDAQRAEKIFWDTFADRFGALEIFKVSGGCAGPICATRSDEMASATYAQLAATFGPRPQGLEKSGAVGQSTFPGWAIAVAVGLVVVITAAVIVLVVVLRRRRNRPPEPPPWPPWPPGAPASPYGPPSQ
jgi:hypothetical protein